MAQRRGATRSHSTNNGPYARASTGHGPLGAVGCSTTTLQRVLHSAHLRPGDADAAGTGTPHHHTTTPPYHCTTKACLVRKHAESNGKSGQTGKGRGPLLMGPVPAGGCRALCRFMMRSVECPPRCGVQMLNANPYFFFLTDSRSSKSTQDCAWESGRLQHMIQWIPATRGTWQRPRVHMP